MSERDYKAHVARVNRATDRQMRDAIAEARRQSDDPNAGSRAEMKGIYTGIWDRAFRAGMEAGMREAAGIVDACLPPGEIDSWNDGWLCGIEAASAAILSAIGTQEDGQ